MPTLDAALAANRQAMTKFLTKACTVPAGRWAQPVTPGKWSPAQIADHVAVSYEVAVRALKGDTGIGSAPWFLRPIARAFAFTSVLNRGAFPEKMRGPASFAPSISHPTYDASVIRMEAAVADLEMHTREMANAGKTTFTHPVFGELSVVDYVKYSELHTKHHQEQLG